MPRMIGTGLSRREREIMDILYRAGKATVAEIMEAMPEPPTGSATRSILRVLQEKGHIRHIEDGKRYVYLPVEPRKSAARSALQNVVQNFFGGSLESAVKSFLFDSDIQLSDEELVRMADAIEQARNREGG